MWTSVRHTRLFRITLLTAGVIFVYCLFGEALETGRLYIQEAQWSYYMNARYGFATEIPANWEMARGNGGMEIRNPHTGKIYSLMFRGDENALFANPAEDYLIQRIPETRPYLYDTLPAVRMITSESGAEGWRLEYKIRKDAGDRKRPEKWLSAYSDSQIVITCFPSAFMGDQHVNVLEFGCIGAPDSVYNRMVSAFRYLFPHYSQKNLLELGMIDSSEIPYQSTPYVGETQGFRIDIDGDGRPDWLIIGMCRTVTPDDSKCFFKLYRQTDSARVKVLHQYYLENSFLRSDIQVCNIDNVPGYEVLFRFTDYGSPWGNNNSVMVYYHDGQYRFFEFGPFAEARDVDGDGVDEVIASKKTQFSLGAIATWYDIFSFRNGQFTESNYLYKNYYRDAILPVYREQLIQARNELMETNVPRIRLSLYYLVRRLQRYITWSERIARGEPMIPPEP